MAISPWTIEQQQAQFQLPGFRATLNIGDPARGLTGLAVAGQQLPGELLSIRIDGARPGLLDAYVRGSDLVTTYSESTSWPFRVQIYWRDCMSEYPGTTAAIELIASVQTHLLDTHPEMFAASQFDAPHVPVCSLDPPRGNLTPLESPSENDCGPGCFLVRELRNVSYAELIHPADFRGSTVQRNGATTLLKHKLFAQRLEKGVILRARVLGLFVEARRDIEVVRSAYEHFCGSAPPLTT